MFKPLTPSHAAGNAGAACDQQQAAAAPDAPAAPSLLKAAFSAELKKVLAGMVVLR